MKNTLSVVLPFHNEEENVSNVVAEMHDVLSAYGLVYELVCVDSGSTDATGSIIAKLASEDDRVVHVIVDQKGYGLAVLRGLASACKELVCVASGDGQVDPRDILKGYAVMDITGVDLIKPRRFTRDDGAYRRFVSVCCSAMMKMAFGLKGWDFMAPPKIWRRELLDRLGLVSEDRFIDTELLVKCKYLGVTMEEVGVTYRKREHGEGKVDGSTIVEYLGNIIHWRRSYRELVVEVVKKD